MKTKLLLLALLCGALAGCAKDKPAHKVNYAFQMYVAADFGYLWAKEGRTKKEMNEMLAKYITFLASMEEQP